MKDKLRKIIDEWLETKKVDGVVGLTEEKENIKPHLFQKGDTSFIALTPKYPLASVMMLLQEHYPEKRFGIIARECDIRAMVELHKREKKIDIERVDIIGIACTKKEVEECACDFPYPHMAEVIVGEKIEIETKNLSVDRLLNMELNERLFFWKYQFDKCMKCYGCRNACPLCICSECVLEDDLWVKGGRIPPPFPLFHLIRAVHTSGRCIGCGECEKACPMDIPLTTLYTLLRNNVKELFDYNAGIELDKEIPLLTTLDETPMKEEG